MEEIKWKRAQKNTAADEGSPLSSGLSAVVARSQTAGRKADAVGRLYLLIFLMYPSITNKIFDSFHCREVGPGTSVLIADYSVTCTQDGQMTAEYSTLTMASSLLVALWPVGIPVMLFTQMYRARKLIREQDEETLQQYSFVIGDYKAEFWWWESIELSRKLVLAGLIGLLGRGTIGQSVLAVTFAFMFFGLHYRAQPFETPMLNNMKSLAEVQVFMILLVCIVQRLAESNEFGNEAFGPEAYGIMQTIVTLSIFPCTAYMLSNHVEHLGDQLSDKLSKTSGRKEPVAASGDKNMKFKNPIHDADEGETSESGGASEKDMEVDAVEQSVKRHRCHSYVLVFVSVASVVYIWSYVHASSLQHVAGTIGVTSYLGMEGGEDTVLLDSADGDDGFGSSSFGG